MNSKSRSLSKGPKKRIISWPEYISMVDELIHQIISSKIKFSCVFGPPRGGVIPAVIISHALNKEFIDDYGFHLNHRRVLIVDDIVDTSETLNMYIKQCQVWKVRCWTASLFKHKNSPITPNFFVEETDCWVQFPYEKD